MQPQHGVQLESHHGQKTCQTDVIDAVGHLRFATDAVIRRIARGVYVEAECLDELRYGQDGDNDEHGTRLPQEPGGQGRDAEQPNAGCQDGGNATTVQGRDRYEVEQVEHQTAVRDSEKKRAVQPPREKINEQGLR